MTQKQVVRPLRTAKPATAAPRKRRIDGRTLRRTGRTVPFATRVSEAFDDQFRMIAERDGLRFTELLELSLEAYEAAQAPTKGKKRNK